MSQMEGPGRALAFCRLWTLKEAYVKARGLGIAGIGACAVIVCVCSIRVDNGGRAYLYREMMLVFAMPAIVVDGEQLSAGLDKFSFSGLGALDCLDFKIGGATHGCKDGTMMSVMVDMSEADDEASRWQMVALSPSTTHALAVAVGRSVGGEGVSLTAVRTRPMREGSDEVLDCGMLQIWPCIPSERI